MIKSERKVFSVVVTAHNRRNFLLNALRSVVNQDFPLEKIEIILLKNFLDAEIDSFCRVNNIITINYSADNENNLGNYLYEGIRRSDAEIISFLDDDDEWDTHKVSRIVNIFNKHADLCYVHNDFDPINEIGETIKHKRMVDPVINKYAHDYMILTGHDLGRTMRSLFAAKADFNLSCMSIRKSCLTKELMQLLRKIEGAPDAFFFFSVLLTNRSLCILSTHLTKYRFHSTNISNISNLHSKGMQVARQLKTLEMLYQFFSVNGNNGYELLSLKMMVTEYELLRTIFLQQYSRRWVLRQIITMFIFPHRVSNPLRWRVVIFSLLGTVDPSFPTKLYKFFTHS